MIAHDAIGLFDRGFGPYILPVAPPDGVISTLPLHPLNARDMGKAPGRLTQSGWVPVSVHDQRQRCHDLKTAKLWHENWGANTGFVASDGYVFLDNDQGEEFSRAIRTVLVDAGVTPFRRYVLAPKHKRDAFLVRVLDFTGDPASIANRDPLFLKGTMTGKLQVLAHGRQLVVAGMHPGTKCPYVWDCDIGDLEADVPVLSDKKFDDCIRNLMELLARDGWTVKGRASGTTARTPRSGGVAIATTPTPIATPEEIKPAIDHMRELLSYIPNRELPVDAKDQTAADKWLDDYGNWATVPYRIASQLGRPVAISPEARDLWLEWVTARPQGQDVDSMWSSVLNQPSWDYGSIAVDKLVDELGARPKAPDFPDVDPNDPMVKTVPTPVWDALRKEWAGFVPGGYLHLPSGAVTPRQSFNDTNRHLLKELLAELAPSRKKNDKMPSVADLFSTQPDRIVVSRLNYAPGENIGSPLYPDPKHEGAFVYNNWRPADFPLRASVTKAEIMPWLDHVEFVLGSPGECELFVKWCAFNVQCPKDKSNWHYLVISVPGLGKDLMVLPVKHAIGSRNAKEVEAAQLMEPFNDPFEAKLLVVNELRQSTVKDNKMLWNRFKQAMTTPPPDLFINHKYQKRIQIPNRIAFILFANDHNPLALDANDRRLYVRNQRHLQPKDKDYYEKLSGWLVANKDDVASYLMTYPLTEADKTMFRGVAPDSLDKAPLIDMNLDPLEDAILDIMQEAQDGKRSLLIEIGALIELLGAKGVRFASAGRVRGCLLDLERQGKGAGRVRVNSANPGQCGAIKANGQSRRLWYLGYHPSGQSWSTLGDASLIAIWGGKGLPPSATILNFPSATQDEPI